MSVGSANVMSKYKKIYSPPSLNSSKVYLLICLIVKERKFDLKNPIKENANVAMRQMLLKASGVIESSLKL